MKILTKNPQYVFILLAVIFVAALIVRLTPVIKTPETLKWGFGPYSDSYMYLVPACNLYKGHGFSRTDDGWPLGNGVKEITTKYEPLLTRGPVYPFFIATVYKFFGNEKDMGSYKTWHKNLDKVRVVQCLLDALVCILVFFISYAISNGSFLPALISSGLYVFSFYNIYYTKALLSESVTTFLLTSSLLFCILGIRHGRSCLWGLAGALFGLVVLTKPEYLLFPAFLLLYMVLIDRQDFLKAVKKPFIFLIAAAIVVIPWTIRNYCVSKEFIPVAVSGIGWSMFLGTLETNTNWQSWSLPTGTYDSIEEKNMAQSLHKAIADALSIGNIQAKDFDNSLMKLARKRIQEHPIECLKRWIIKIPRLWYQFYIPMYATREASGGFFIFYFICALSGLWKGTKDEKILMAPIILLFVYLTLVFLPLHVEPRYGVALMPGIICMASIGIWKIIILSIRLP
jgi:4-amino-4-deoxy-L-arabinose transferase-like glycosyltransferase